MRRLQGTIATHADELHDLEKKQGRLAWQEAAARGKRKEIGAQQRKGNGHNVHATSGGRTSQFAPAPRGGSIRTVNPTGGRFNCAQCAIAVDKRLAGDTSAVAGRGGVTLVRDVEAAVGGRFGPALSSGNLTAEIGAAGPGARGIVFGSRGPGEVGHFFNVVNQRGTVRFLDGQSGRAADLDDGFVNFHLLRTR